MCTLTLAWQVFDDAPIAVAANRDEAIARPSEPPGRYREDPTVFAPRDTEAGGTWIGVNEHGLFAGITNRWNDADLAGERSRGLLVADALECASTIEAVETVERTTSEYEYAGFSFVVADERDAVWIGWDGDLEIVPLDPGVHVVVNVGFDDRFSVPETRAEAGTRQAENARRLREVLTPQVDEGSAGWLERAGTVLGDHEYGVCIHGDGFGTKSSTLLTLGEEPTFAFADGPPCETSYEHVDVERHI
ncbi:NRDE family protein [Natrialbaceae archaeon A-gly3]